MNMTWNDANVHCLSKKQRLVTLKTPKDFTDYKRFVSSVRGMRSVYIGAQLTLKRGSVAVIALYKHVSSKNQSLRETSRLGLFENSIYEY